MIRPTRQGISTLLVGLVVLAIARTFGIAELFLVGAALIILPLGALLAAGIRPARLAVQRRLSPPLMPQGTPGAVRIVISNPGAVRSPPVTLTDTIDSHATNAAANIDAASLPARSSIAAVYDVPTIRRGTIKLGPMLLTRTDPFRLAQRRSIVAATDRAVVTPATVTLPFASMTSGPIGVQLRAAARRLGPGEFHALREYVDGDEPKSVHWKASARTDSLKVRQYELQRLQRATIVLDISQSSYERLEEPNESFERSVSIAASLVQAACNAELNTRFAAGSMLDLRGPDVGPDTLRALADISPVLDNATPGSLQHTGDGLGLVIAITPTGTTALGSMMASLRDPTATEVLVLTDDVGGRWNTVAAPSLAAFQQHWLRLVGVRQPARPAHNRQPEGAPVTSNPRYEPEPER